MRSLKDIHEGHKETKMVLRPLPLWVMLFCGIIITLIGIYLYATNNIGGGVTLPAGRARGSHDTVLTGTSTIVIGVVICMFPIYQLIKKSSGKTDS